MTPRDEWRLYMDRNRAARRDYYERTRCEDCGVLLAVEAIGPPRAFCDGCRSRRRDRKAPR